MSRTLADAVRRSLGTETFPALLERLYTERYTGSVILHFGEGVATTAEFPRPPERIRLDKHGSTSAALTATVDSRPVSRGSADTSA